MKGAHRLAALLAATITGVTFTATAPAAATPVGGKTLWTATYFPTQNGQAGALGEAVSPDSSRVFVVGYTGFSAPQGATGGATIAYDASNGATLWKRASPSGSAVTVPSSVAVSPDGGTVFVTGLYRASSSSGAVTIGYNAATGATLWSRREPNTGSPVSLAVSPDGATLYVMTQHYNALAYDAATGKLKWASLAGVGRNGAAARGALSPDGSRLFITGASQDSGGFGEYQTAGFDAGTGTLLWVRHYSTRSPANPGVQNLATSVAVSRDAATVYVAGFVTGGAGSDAIFAYDAATGATRWQQLWLPTTQGYTGATVSLTVSRDGSALFAAAPDACAQGVCWVTQARQASTGAVLWSDHHNSGMPGVSTSPFSLAVGPGGQALAVTGTVYTPQGDLYQTVAYRTTDGFRFWKSNTVGSGTDPPLTAFSPSGIKVLVSGAVQHTQPTGFVTVAYRS